jgi:hypothetical protein
MTVAGRFKFNNEGVIRHHNGCITNKYDATVKLQSEKYTYFMLSGNHIFAIFKRVRDHIVYSLNYEHISAIDDKSLACYPLNEAIKAITGIEFRGSKYIFIFYSGGKIYCSYFRFGINTSTYCERTVILTGNLDDSLSLITYAVRIEDDLFVRLTRRGREIVHMALQYKNIIVDGSILERRAREVNLIGSCHYIPLYLSSRMKYTDCVIYLFADK